MGQRRVTEAFVNVSEVGEMFGMPPSNVAKTLARHNVPFQTLTVGKREMKVYLRDDVDRVMRDREAKLQARAAKASA